MYLVKHVVVQNHATRLLGDSGQKKLDDTEAEILYRRRTLEQKEASRMKLLEAQARTSLEKADARTSYNQVVTEHRPQI